MRTDWKQTQPYAAGCCALFERTAHGCEIVGVAWDADSALPTVAHRQVYARTGPVALSASVHGYTGGAADDLADRIAGELSALAARLNAAPADADEAMARR